MRALERRVRRLEIGSDPRELLIVFIASCLGSTSDPECITRVGHDAVVGPAQWTRTPNETPAAFRERVAQLQADAHRRAPFDGGVVVLRVQNRSCTDEACEQVEGRKSSTRDHS